MDKSAACSKQQLFKHGQEDVAGLITFKDFKKCPEQDSNLRPSAPEADALSTELSGRAIYCTRFVLEYLFRAFTWGNEQWLTGGQHLYFADCPG